MSGTLPTRRVGRPVFICGDDDRAGPRGTDCLNRLHDHPLPSGYVDAAVVAQRRLNKRWANPRCPDCGLYGWAPGLSS